LFLASPLLAVCRPRQVSTLRGAVGFSAFVIGYAVLNDAHPNKPIWQVTVRTAINLSIALTFAIAGAVALHSGRNVFA
jgi:hypothetical protein